MLETSAWTSTEERAVSKPTESYPMLGPEERHRVPCSQSTQKRRVSWILDCAVQQNRQADLKQRMTRNDTQKALETLPTRLDDFFGKPVGKNLSGQRGDIHARRLAFEDISECFKVGIAPSNARMA